jgi:hypothetical protein
MTNSNQETSNGEWSVQRLQAMSHAELVELYRTLDAPEFEEMDGEFRARLLAQTGRVMPYVWKYTILVTPINGLWLGKAFQPLADKDGHGYNYFRRRGKVLRKYPMRTTILPSKIDGRDAFRLTYSKYRSLLGRIGAADEVRKLDDNLYLGMGVGTLGQSLKRDPVPFSLSGPPDPFVGTDSPARLA